ncbi:MAG: glutathione S-transferase family protein [Candidatus Binatia bacterium]
MKIYDSAGPNPKKLRVYLAEKRLSIPLEFVDILSGENRTPEFLRKNPSGRVPVLELDDGTCLPESLAIMEYLEELHPEPPMIGTTPLERARVRALERLAELGVMFRVSTIFLNTSPVVTKSAMAGRLKQSPEAADYARWYLDSALAVLDTTIAQRPFVAGDRPTIADCTLFAALDFAVSVRIPFGSSFPNVLRWYETFGSRPSARA